MLHEHAKKSVCEISKVFDMELNDSELHIPCDTVWMLPFPRVDQLVAQMGHLK